MITVTDLSGGYGGRRVLTDVSLAVRDGETVAVLGANTAGKTTLIRAICGQLPVVSSSIRFDNAELVGMPAHRRVAAGIAVVPEGRHVFPAMSVEDRAGMVVMASSASGAIADSSRFRAAAFCFATSDGSGRPSSFATSSSVCRTVNRLFTTFISMSRC